jgi:hypothetical protein
MSDQQSDTLVYMRDVMLNGLFRMLAKLAMEQPARMHGVSRRDERRMQIDVRALSPRGWCNPTVAGKR